MSMLSLSSRLLRWILFFVPISIVFVAYSPVYNAPFLWDDHIFIEQWPMIHTLDNIGALLAGALPPGHEGDYRPFHTIYGAVLYQFFGTNPSPYHILAVFIHASTTGIVFLIFLKLLRLFSFSNDAWRFFTAFLGSLLFGLHPVATEPVAFIQASFDTIGITFGYISYFLFLLVLERLKKNEKLASWFIYLLSSVMFSFLAFFSYEFLYTLPIIIALTAWLVLYKSSSFRYKLIHIGRLCVPFVTVLVATLLLRIGVFGLVSQQSFTIPGVWFMFLALTRALYLYFFQTVSPIHLATIHEIAPGITTIAVDKLAFTALRITDWKTLVGIGGTGGILLVVFLFYKRIPSIALGLLWYLIGLLPALSIIIGLTVASERYVYFSLIGFALAVSTGITIIIKRIPNSSMKHIAAIIICSLFIILYGNRTYIRARDWTDPIHFWNKEAKVRPYIGRIHNALGEEYQLQGKLDEALAEYETAVRLQPFEPAHYYNTSRAYFDMGKYSEAKIHAEKAVSLDPDFPVYFLQLQLVYEKIRDASSSVQFLQNITQTGKGTAGMHLYLGNIALQTGDTMVAELSYRKAIELNPSLSPAYVNLSAILYEQNNVQEAVSVLELGKKHGEKSADILYNLSVAYLSLNKPDAAKSIIQEGITMYPKDLRFSNLLNKL